MLCVSFCKFRFLVDPRFFKNLIRALLCAVLLNSASIGRAAENLPCNKSFDEKTAIAALVGSSAFKREAAKMSTRTKFAFLPNSITIDKSDFACRAAVRVSVDEGDHFSFFREYIVFGKQNMGFSVMSVSATATGE